MSLRWLVDPDVARENPRRARIGLFIAGLLAGAVVGFFRLGDHDPWKTLLAALLGGLAGLVIAFRVQGRTPVSRTHAFELALAAMGTGLVIISAAVADLRVALSAVPLLLFAAAVYAVKKRIARR